MSNSDMFKLSVGALKERKLRSILTILMVVVGSALLIALFGLSNGFSGFIEDQFELLSPNMLFISPANDFGPPEQQSNIKIELTDNVVATFLVIPGVKDVVPIIQQGAVVTSGANSGYASIIGYDQTKVNLIYPTFELESGGIVYQYDTIGMLIGANVKTPSGSDTIFTDLGQNIKVEFDTVKQIDGKPTRVTESTTFIVKGVAKKMGSAGFVSLDDTISISLQSANNLFHKDGKYDTLLVITNSPYDNDRVTASIKEIYGNDIGITSPQAIVETFSSFITGFSYFLVGIAGFSLVVASIGVITTLYTSVMERTREIGLMKALGFKNSSVLLFFLSEAAIIGMIGATTGIIIGMVIGSLVISILSTSGGFGSGLTPVFLLNDILFVWGLSVILSIFAGVYPAWQASKLDPVVALRKE